LVNVTLTDEYKKLATTFGWKAEHFYKCNVNALSHAFISNSEKVKLGKILKSNYNTNDVNRFA
jgi:adenosine deaminase